VSCDAAARDKGVRRACAAADRARARGPVGDARATQFLLGSGRLPQVAAERCVLALDHSTPGADRR
jgi:hypothetical protein